MFDEMNEYKSSEFKHIKKKYFILFKICYIIIFFRQKIYIRENYNKCDISLDIKKLNFKK